MQTSLQTSQVVATRVLTLYPWRLIVPTAAFVAVFVFVVSVGQTGDLRFYQAAATIIVVLVLSLSMQGHFFVLKEVGSPPEWVERLGRWIRLAWVASARFSLIAILAYLGVGETAALYALATTSQSEFLLGVAGGAIASGFFAIGTLALLGEGPSPVEDPSTVEDPSPLTRPPG